MRHTYKAGIPARHTSQTYEADLVNALRAFFGCALDGYEPAINVEDI